MTARRFELFAEDRDLDAPAIVGPKTFSLRELANAVHATAVSLPSGGSEVLVACEDRTRFIIAVLAAWAAGRSVALPPNLRPATLAELSRSGAIDLVLTDAEVQRTGPEAAELLRNQLRGGADRTLASVYTSGTTGEHRASTKTARQLLGEAAALAKIFELGPQARVLATVPPHHIYGLLFGVLAPLVGGATIIAFPALHAPTVASVAGAHAATVLVSTPAHLRGLSMLDAQSLHTVSHVYSSGAPLRASTATMLHDRFGVEVVEVLGSTETGGIAWRPARNEDTTWTPLPGVEVRADRDGAILLRSAFGPDASSYVRGDDRIELHESGRFWHRGRIDDVVKVGGKRVSLGALQSRLLELDGVEDAAVLADPTADGRGTKIRAAVVTQRSTESIRESLCAWFDPVAIPRRIIVVPALPREPTGKLRRDDLENLFASSAVPSPHPPRRLVTRPAGAQDSPEHQRLCLDVPSELLWFRGHFEGHPILPGLVQLEQIVQSTQEAWPALGRLSRVRRLKFKRAIAPGDSLMLDLRREAAHVRFELRRDDEVCASGALVFAPEASAG